MIKGMSFYATDLAVYAESSSFSSSVKTVVVNAADGADAGMCVVILVVEYFSVCKAVIWQLCQNQRLWFTPIISGSLT